MSEKVKIKVKQWHIDEGEREQVNCCAIALAIQDVQEDNLLCTYNSKDLVPHVESDATMTLRDNDGNIYYSFVSDDGTRNECEGFIDLFDNQNEYFENQDEIDKNLRPFEFKAKIEKEHWLD